VVASCVTCSRYVDGRSPSKSKHMSGQPCVYVPKKGLCFPANHARAKGWTVQTDCEAPT
jgi:hypothetical protein